jgi:hypothetical protein
VACSERSVAAATAAVYYFDSATRNWKNVDGGLSSVNIYENPANGSYRVVAMSLKQQGTVRRFFFSWIFTLRSFFPSTWLFPMRVNVKYVILILMCAFQTPINSAIFAGLTYQKASASFHQWADTRNTYGLNFASEADANTFAGIMATAIDKVKGMSFAFCGRLAASRCLFHVSSLPRCMIRAIL